jgi:YggT family protein
MGSFLEIVIQALLTFMWWAIIASAIISWLVAFNVLNMRHPVARQVEYFLWAVTRPVLWPIRKVIPPLGSVDISPLIALVIIGAAQQALIPWLFGPIKAAIG